MEPENELRDPQTSAQRLYEIAQQRNDLHAQVLSHPNVYPGLAEWVKMVSPGVQPAGWEPVSAQPLDAESNNMGAASASAGVLPDSTATQETQVLPAAALQMSGGAPSVPTQQSTPVQQVQRQSVMGQAPSDWAAQGGRPQGGAPQSGAPQGQPTQPTQATQFMGPAPSYGAQSGGQVPQSAGYPMGGQAQVGPSGVRGGGPVRPPDFSADAAKESRRMSPWLYAVIGVAAALLVAGLAFGAYALFSDKGGDEEVAAEATESQRVSPKKTIVQEPIEMEEVERERTERDEDRDRSRTDDRSSTERYAGASIPGAYPGAGGPIPAEAMEAATVRYEQYGTYAVFITPSENIGCDLNVEGSGCGVLSYIQDKTAGTDVGGDSQWWFYFPDSGDASVGAKGDVAFFMDTTQPVQILEYGQVLYWGDMVCASESTGLTCWNAATGHGAFMSRASYTLF